MLIGWVETDDLKNSTSLYAVESAEFASWLLYKLSAEKYPGIHTVTEWYGHNKVGCSGTLCDAVSDFYELPRPQVATSGLRKLRLRHTPILSVQEVEVGGSTLDQTQYRVANFSSLVKTSRECWNLGQGVTVSYTYGVNPPAGGRLAATYLTDQLILAFEESEQCELPERVSSVTRQGISYDILDPQQFISEGRTGIYQVDMFLQAANPRGALKKPKIFSTDSPYGERYS